LRSREGRIHDYEIDLRQLDHHVPASLALDGHCVADHGEDCLALNLAAEERAHGLAQQQVEASEVAF